MPNTAIVLAVLVLTFVGPTVVSTAICYSVAGADERQSAGRAISE